MIAVMTTNLALAYFTAGVLIVGILIALTNRIDPKP